MSASLIKKIKELFGNRVNYRPYNIRSTEIMYGTPPTPILGLAYVFARHNRPQTKLIMGFTGTGPFVSNNNSSGIIEIGIMTGSASCAGIEVMDLTGIPFPIIVTDKDSGGTSTVVASACRRTDTPEWRRDKLPGISIFTFSTPRLLISDGLRLAA